MKKISLLLLGLIWATFTHAQSKLLVACIDDHPPYQYLGAKPYGTHIRALETLADILGKELSFIQSPNFARCVAMLKNGDVDVIAGLNKTEQRAKFALYAPFKSADALRVISKKDITINSYDDFKGKIIGVSRGSLYFPRFDDDDSLNKVSVQNNRIGFSMLLKNRIDIIMLSPEILETYAVEIKKAKLNVSPIELEEVRANVTLFGFSKRHKLNISDQELINKVTNAYENGVFK